MQHYAADTGPPFTFIKYKPKSLFKGICYWNYKNESFFRIKEYGWDIIPVHYNTLVSYPQQELERIFDFLNLRWNKKVLNHHKIKHEEGLQNDMMLGNTNPKRKIDKLSLKKWKVTLDKPSVKLIEENTKFNYEKLKNYI